MTTFGVPTWPDELLALLRPELAAALSLPADRVFLSLAADADHLAFPPADRFCVVGGQVRFRADPASAAGGGRLNTAFAGPVQVRVFSRLGTDQELRDGRLVADRSAGLLRDGRLVADRLQMWTPALPGGCPLRQPARVSGFGVEPKAGRPAGSWGVLTLELDLTFVAALT